jgi:hypothetical protein
VKLSAADRFPVAACLDAPVSDVTVTGSDTVSTEPSAAVPVKLREWEPAGIDDGSANVASIVPVDDAIAVPSTTGSECSTAVTVAPGAHPLLTTDTVPPLATVVLGVPAGPKPMVGSAAVGAVVVVLVVVDGGIVLVVVLVVVDGGIVLVVVLVVVVLVVVVVAHGVVVITARPTPSESAPGPTSSVSDIADASAPVLPSPTPPRPPPPLPPSPP